MQETALDDVDMRIIRALEKNGRATNVELSAAVGLSESQCLRRVKRLEADGVITGYSARIDRVKLGLDLAAFVLVTLDMTVRDGRRSLMRFLETHPAVEVAYGVTGDTDVITRVAFANSRALTDFIVTQLMERPEVAGTRSYLLLDTVE